MKRIIIALLALILPNACNAVLDAREKKWREECGSVGKPDSTTVCPSGPDFQSALDMAINSPDLSKQVDPAEQQCLMTQFSPADCSRENGHVYVCMFEAVYEPPQPGQPPTCLAKCLKNGTTVWFFVPAALASTPGDFSGKDTEDGNIVCTRQPDGGP